MKIKDLFNIFPGNSDYHSKNSLISKKNGTPLISAKTIDNGICGYYDILATDNNCISLSVVGEHSCTAFLHIIPCCINDNCLKLIPKTNLNLNELLYYVTIFNSLKYKFPSYGRNITIKRFSNIEIPSPQKIPNWINNYETLDYSKYFMSKNTNKILLNKKSWKMFKLISNREESGLFQRYRGGQSEILSQSSLYPLISSSSVNNGANHKKIFTNKVHKGNVLTVSANGHCCDVFYQKYDFAATDDVHILKPNFNLDSSIGIFIATIIKANQFKYNYARKLTQARLENIFIPLPINELGLPNFKLMKNYIESLNYSYIL